MELLRWFIEGLWSLLQIYFGFWIRLGSLAQEAFGLSMPSGVMEFISVVIGVGLLIGVLARPLLWDRHGNRPQLITLPTALTPDQVVRNDLRDLLRVIVTAIGIGIVLAVLISTISPPP